MELQTHENFGVQKFISSILADVEKFEESNHENFGFQKFISSILADVEKFAESNGTIIFKTE